MFSLVLIQKKKIKATSCLASSDTGGSLSQNHLGGSNSMPYSRKNKLKLKPKSLKEEVKYTKNTLVIENLVKDVKNSNILATNLIGWGLCKSKCSNIVLGNDKCPSNEKLDYYKIPTLGPLLQHILEIHSLI